MVRVSGCSAPSRALRASSVCSQQRDGAVQPAGVPVGQRRGCSGWRGCRGDRGRARPCGVPGPARAAGSPAPVRPDSDRWRPANCGRRPRRSACRGSAGDLRLGGVHGRADGHVLAQAAPLPLGPGGGQDVVLEEAEHGTRLGRRPHGLLALRLRLGRCARPASLGDGRVALRRATVRAASVRRLAAETSLKVAAARRSARVARIACQVLDDRPDEQQGRERRGRRQGTAVLAARTSAAGRPPTAGRPRPASPSR